MGLFGNIIKNGISNGIGNAIEKAVSKVVEEKVTPTINKRTTEIANATINAVNSNADLYKENLEEINKATEELKKSVDELNAKNDEQFINNWNKNEILSKFPKWCFGGTNFDLFTNGENEFGFYYWLSISDVGEKECNQYIELLKENGFTQDSKEDYLYRKEIDGKIYTFNVYEAYITENRIEIKFYIGD